MRRYAYVGPAELRELAADARRTRIERPADLLAWISPSGTRHAPRRDEPIMLTFVVDLAGALWVADQRSEHVACAAGQPVLAAGELGIELRGGLPVVAAATNQSTGYCPEPACWTAVAAAFERIGLAHPGDWTRAFEFRRCDGCGATNLIKDDWFECALCGAALGAEWNYPAAEG